MSIALDTFTRLGDGRFSTTMTGRPLSNPYVAAVSNRSAPKNNIQINPNSSLYVFSGDNTTSNIYDTEAKAFPALSFKSDIKSIASYFFTYYQFGHPYWINGS